MDIIEIYNKHLKNLDKKNYDTRYLNRRHFFQASSTGGCYKAHFYRMFKLKPEELDPRVRRLFHLGNMVHESIQSAIAKENQDALIEFEIYDINLGIRGFLDMYIPQENTLWDIKTIGSFPYKKKFGKNPENSPNRLHEMQIATYAYLIAGYLGIDPYSIKMKLLYYNKDTSAIKIEEVNTAYIDTALNYWLEMKELRKRITIDNLEDELMQGSYNVPVYPAWQCSYCSFSRFCIDHKPYIFEEDNETNQSKERKANETKQK